MMEQNNKFLLKER